jgi:hypothetical protein
MEYAIKIREEDEDSGSAFCHTVVDVKLVQ